MKPALLSPVYLGGLLLLGACWGPVENLPSPVELPEVYAPEPALPSIPELDQEAPADLPRTPLPRLANAHRRDLTRIVQQEWGLSGNVALHAAQIHQESAWKSDAKSWAGAEGLAQFMPSTATWIAEIHPDLAPVAPYSPDWAMRAQSRYNKHLIARVQGHTDCDRWWHTLRSYNGGLGHLNAESRNAADAADRRATDATCGSARRSIKHCPENLGYPRRILIDLEPRYLTNGWPGRATCST
jgi:soluble lytic murein transglycosylase-like protein